MTNLETQKGLTCDVCEAMCLDAVDGTLTTEERAALELHVAGCVACTEQFAEAQRGAAWMEMLKSHKPEPSSSLLSSILAKTRGAAAGSFAGPHATLQAVQTLPALLPMPLLPLPGIVAAPVVAGGKLLQFRQRFVPHPATAFSGSQIYLQPRLAMTAAMAFFSLALTMNLTGTKLSDLRPGALHRTVADARAGAARSFQSLRVVYQVESKVSELRQDEIRDDRDSYRGGASSDQPSTDAQRRTNRPQEDKPTAKPSKPDDGKPEGSSKLEPMAEPQFRLADTIDPAQQNAAQAQPVQRQKGA